jgi:hypothetical protein
MNRSAVLLLPTVALAALSACDDAPADALTSCEQGMLVPESVSTDVLFVIDDSSSMAEEQSRVQAQLAAFLTALDSSPIPNDYQIGVTNTSVEGFNGGSVYPPGSINAGTEYPAGRLVAVSATGVYDATYSSSKRIISRSSGTRVADFEDNVVVGTDGTGKEQGFAAARRALEASAAGGANEGFLRPGARLAVIFVSDEDDCSSQVSSAIAGNSDCESKKDQLDPVSDLVSYLRGPIDGETREVLVAAIVGLNTVTLAPSCGAAENAFCENPPVTGTCATALDRGERYAALVDQMGTAVTVRDSICDDSFAESLDAIARLIAPTRMTLQGAPADWRMLAVSVDTGTTTLACEVAPSTGPIPATADVVYAAPQSGSPGYLEFLSAGGCALGPGYQAQVQVVCAR